MVKPKDIYLVSYSTNVARSEASSIFILFKNEAIASFYKYSIKFFVG
ncbi:MAG: hypothetical protein KKD86_18755 [Bacteroidetes bacterium]|nr:hypothetical protein [Bacteroidota bacterium]